MISPTIVLIVTVVLSAIALIIPGVCVLKNLFRPVLRSGMQLAVALLCIPIALLLAKVTCSVVTSAVLGMLDIEMLQQIITDLPSGQRAIEGLAQMVAAPFVFVLIYFVLWVIVGAIVGIVVRSLEKGGVKFAVFKNKGIGAGIGVVCGLVLVVVYLVPLIGFTGIVPDALTIVSDMEIENGKPLVELSEEDKEAIDQIVNTPALSVPRALGGKALFASLTTTKLDGEKLSLTNEIDTLCPFVVTVFPVVQKGVENIALIEEADVTMLQTELPALFENSTLLRVLGAETLSGLSRSWLSGESFLTIDKPETEGVTAIVVDSALALFVDTTKDTIVNDIRGLTPMLSAALAVSKLQSGENMDDLVEQLAQAASTPEIKSLLLTAGVSIVAKELGLYNNKREIYDAYSSTLATLSTANLTEEQLRQEIEILNDKYAISMTEEEVAALAASLIAHPYTGSLTGDPSLLLPEESVPVFVGCATTNAPVVWLTETEDDDLQAWLAAITATAAEQQESLSWLSEGDNIPSALVTGEDLTALTTKEALEDFGEEEIKALFSAAAQVMSSMSSEGGLDLESTIGVLGEALGTVAATESGQALVDTLVTGALQSEKVCETMGITPGQATTIANSIKENGGLENLNQTAKDVSNLMTVIDRLKESVTSGGAISSEDVHTLITTMNDSSAALLRSLCTPEMLKKAGIPAASTQGVAHLLDDLLGGLVEARKNWSDEAYQKEADALCRVLQLALGAKSSTGNTFEERFGMSAEQLIETVQASELLTTVLPDSIDELYAENPDALGLSERLNANDRALLLEKIAEYKQTADEGGDKLLDALARMLG